jgi:hypothetical protein
VAWLCAKGIVTCQVLVTPLLELARTSNLAVAFEGPRLTYQKADQPQTEQGVFWKFICSDKNQGTGCRLAKHVFVHSLWSRFSCPTLLSPGVAVLHKCVNPDCSAQFRYLHQGRLFEIEIQYLKTADSAGQGTLHNGKGYVERCWLCDQCATHIALRFDPRRGLVVASSLGRAEGVITLATPQSTANAATERKRALIRSLDMDLRISTKRNAAGQRNVRKE